MTGNQEKSLNKNTTEKLFIISSEISTFMLFLKSYDKQKRCDYGIELQKRLVNFKKVKEKYSAVLDFKYWCDPQIVRDIKEQIENGSAKTVDEAVKILNL